ncbi:MAG: hypothetical protein LBP79_04100 [Clostridiales bacterium]|jgi:hypothetical protein|nr:hypothetical protein [Clostridiales bacterium]
MAKSKIIKELANNEITLEVALKRLLVLASDLEDDTIKYWVEKELSGYSKDDELPSYRYIQAGQVYFSGVKGSSINHIQYNHNKMQMGYLSVDTWKDLLKEHACREEVAILQTFAQAENAPSIDLTYLASEVAQRTQDGFYNIGCQSITMEFASNQFASIIQKLSTILLNVFIKLDKQYGCLDDLDIDTTSITEKQKVEINKELQQIIFNECTFTNNNNNFEKAKIKGSNVGTENKIDKKQDKKKIKDSNTGKGSNTVNKATTISPKIEIPLNKISKD